MTSDVEELAAITVDCGYHLHREVDPGLLESVYETVLAKRLQDRGLHVARQKPIPVVIDGISFGDAFRADILVEHNLLIEVKSVERLNNVHIKQVLTYLRLTEQPLGLLMNFGGLTFREGVKRIMNNHTKT